MFVIGYKGLWSDPLSLLLKSSCRNIFIKFSGSQEIFYRFLDNKKYGVASNRYISWTVKSKKSPYQNLKYTQKCTTIS